MADPTWNPTTEAELAAAAAQGLLEESHHLDIKRELPGGRGANIELARDLASFGIDGGLVLVGVDENQSSPALHPISLAGLPERVEQIALTRIDEPLPVRTTPIPSVANPADGYLAIRIPPSPLAPHMVEGKYWGRGDKTKYQLPNDEVVRLLERRQRWQRTAGEVLAEYIERDPTVERTAAHVFIIADPISAPDRLLIPIIEPRGDYFQGHLIEFVNRAITRAPRVEFSPNAETAQATDRRGDGWALTTHRLQRGRIVDPETSESSVLELELSERGAIRLFSGRGSDRNENGRHVVFESGLAGLCHQVLGLVRQVAEAGGTGGAGTSASP